MTPTETPNTGKRHGSSDVSDIHAAITNRRAWSLKLIRTLMDEVEFEQADDETRLRMTKYRRR